MSTIIHTVSDGWVGVNTQVDYIWHVNWLFVYLLQCVLLYVKIINCKRKLEIDNICKVL